MDTVGDHEETHPFLNTIDSLCEDFSAQAEAVDVGGPANQLFRENISRLAEIGFFGAGITEAFGGLNLPDWVRRECVERLSAACGVTAFGQNQLHAGGGFIGGSANDDLKRELLPKLSSGEILCGVAFAHLRRAGGSPVTARPVDGGFIVSGNAPWVSDWALLNSFVLGAAVENTGEMLFCYVDRASSQDNLDPTPSMHLAVMTAADTVSIDICDLFIADRYVLQRRDAEHMTRSDYCSITSHVTLPLGCSRGSVRYLRSLGKPISVEAAERLSAEIDAIRADSLYWNGSRADEPEYKVRALKVRAGAISVALRAAETAIAASGGRAHLLTHPAQRRLREAGFYATMALTADTQAMLMETFTHAL